MVTPARNPMFTDVDLKKLTDYDVNLVKPALLFADKVNLVSYRIDLQAQVVSDAFQNTGMPIRYIYAYASLTRWNDEKELERLGMSPNMLCSREDAEALFENRMDYLEFAQKYNDQIKERQRLVAQILRARRDSLVSDELDMAINRKLLECSAWHLDMPSPYQLSWTQVQKSFGAGAVAGLLERLGTATGVPLLEPGAHLQLSQVLGHDRIVQAVHHHDALRMPVAVASAVTSSLPGMNELSIGEIIDLRESLANYLPAFRAAMIKLSEEVSKQTQPDLIPLASEIDLYWQRDIAPVLQEINHEVSRARYPRKLLSAFSSDKAALAGTASAVMLAAGSVFAGAGALIPAAAAAAFPFVKALNDALHSRDDVRKNRLYFLYAVQKRIDQRRKP